MRLIRATISVVLILASCAALAAAQNRDNVPSKPDNQIGPKSYTTLVEDLFGPITASLNLTKEQEFQIIAIITGAQVTAEPLMQRFDEIEQELVIAPFAKPFDELRVQALSEQEATILSQVIALKVFAKAKIYQILTPEQRALVLQEFLPRTQLKGHLGSISIY